MRLCEIAQLFPFTESENLPGEYLVRGEGIFISCGIPYYNDHFHVTLLFFSSVGSFEGIEVANIFFAACEKGFLPIC